MAEVLDGTLERSTQILRRFCFKETTIRPFIFRSDWANEGYLDMW